MPEFPRLPTAIRPRSGNRFRSRLRFRRLLPVSLLAGAALVLGCQGKPLREAELPSSQRNARLQDFRPPDMLAHLSEWFPGDWRVHLLRGLGDSTRDGRLASLLRADSLRPEDPLPAYFLALHHLDTADSGGERLARPHAEKALALDPENGVLKVLLAYILVRDGRLPRARALFMDPRRVPVGSSYQDRLEEVVLGLFSHAGQLNPYTLAEAAALYRELPLPPFEKIADVLYAVFLSTQADSPYDIRVRGREAAWGVFRLGGQLRVGSYGGHRLLSDGYEQRALGFMFQVRAGQFLALFHQAFADIPLDRRSLEALEDVQMEYQDFIAHGAEADTLVSGYLDRWSVLLREEGSMSVGDAVERARAWPLWRKSRFFRYPAGDDA